MKFWYYREGADAESVRPLAGAGIEISHCRGSLTNGSVRPLAGAGIEIYFLPPQCWADIEFAPSRGRELKSRIACGTKEKGWFAPSRGRELKYEHRRHPLLDQSFAPSRGRELKLCGGQGA